MTLINKIASLNTIDLDVLDYKFTGYSDFTADDIYAQERAFIQITDLQEKPTFDRHAYEVDYDSRTVNGIMRGMDREDRCIDYVLPFLFQNCEHVHDMEFFFDKGGYTFYYRLKNNIYSKKDCDLVTRLIADNRNKALYVEFLGMVGVWVDMSDMKSRHAFNAVVGLITEHLTNEDKLVHIEEVDHYTYYCLF